MVDFKKLKQAAENVLYDYQSMKMFVESLDSMPSSSSCSPKLSPSGHKNDPVPRDALMLASSTKYRWVQLIEHQLKNMESDEVSLLNCVYLCFEGKPERKNGQKRIEQFYENNNLSHSAYYRLRDRALEKIVIEALKEGLL